MITTSDAGNIVYRDCKVFGIEVLKSGNIPEGELNDDRIVLHVKSQSSEPYWKKGFVEVNFCVPDRQGRADLEKLSSYERKAMAYFDMVGEYDGSHYRYSIQSTGIERDVPLKCHFVNVRILFEVLNVK